MPQGHLRHLSLAWRSIMESCGCWKARLLILSRRSLRSLEEGTHSVIWGFARPHWRLCSCQCDRVPALQRVFGNYFLPNGDFLLRVGWGVCNGEGGQHVTVTASSRRRSSAKTIVFPFYFSVGGKQLVGLRSLVAGRGRDWYTIAPPLWVRWRKGADGEGFFTPLLFHARGNTGYACVSALYLYTQEMHKDKFSQTVCFPSARRRPRQDPTCTPFRSSFKLADTAICVEKNLNLRNLSLRWELYPNVMHITLFQMVVWYCWWIWLIH